jgi:hypothetical protein
MLLCGAPPFKVIFPGYFVGSDPALSAKARGILGALGIPFNYPNAARTLPSSFWLEITGLQRE